MKFIALVSTFVAVSLASMPCDQDLNEVAHWANNLPVLQKQDKLKWDQLQEFDLETVQRQNIQHKFYQFLGQPLQTACSISKKIGGKWLNSCAWYDGSKYVCLDKWKVAIDQGKCLVYSFGLSQDWSFEETLAEMGCTVRAFDPTIDRPERIKSQKITFEKLGIAYFTGQTQVIDNLYQNAKTQAPVMTLYDILQKYEEGATEITYLKIDVEGSELRALTQILESDALKNVEQIGIEIHTGRVHIKDHEIPEVLSEVLDTIKKICAKYGFKIIEYSPNGCVGKSPQGYYTYFDVVLYRP